MTEASMTPCTSTAVAVLGVLGEPVRLRCGLAEAHPGLHRFLMEWGDSSPTALIRGAEWFGSVETREG